MPNLICRALSFAYDNAETSLFSNLDLVIDTHWRSALCGANGRGKTTLLRLLAGELVPDRGEVERPIVCRLFSERQEGVERTVWQSAKDMAGPFRAWEREIEALLDDAGDEALIRYGELESRYRSRGGYEVDVRLEAELTALGVEERLWRRSLDELSGGEQTRCLLAGLFAAGDGFPLIDEPTNHLDLSGRRLLAEYLAGKAGFLLVSHDRAFLDACVDHVIALNQDTVESQRSNFSSWRGSHLNRLAEQARVNALLKKDIRRLETAAQARRAGADAREADKTSGGRQTLPSERGKDRGFVGARAARQMKRALSVEKRAGVAAAHRRSSLVDVEKAYPLKVLPPETLAPLRAPLVRAREFSVVRSDPLFEPVSFEVRTGDRMALLGPNGCGKTSLLSALTRHGNAPATPGVAHTGTLEIGSRIVVSRAWQIPRWRSGRLRKYLEETGMDEAYFRQVMAALGVRGGLLDQPLEHLSQGQLKKIELARSLCTPAHLYLWDEPLNYVDVDTRERIEEAILGSNASFIFVEHDARFIERMAATRVSLVPRATPGAKKEKTDE